MSIIIDLDKRIRHGKERQFTGVLSIEAEMRDPWYLYFLAGQIVWANTRTHSKRRWHRQLLKHCPELIKQNHSLYQTLTYNTLAKLVTRRELSRKHFSELVTGCISEILFDIVQQGSLNLQASRKPLTYKASPQDAAKFPCISLQYGHVQIWEQAQQDWLDWQKSSLTNILPNQAPVIEQPAGLSELTSQTMFQALTGLVDGQQTLRDLALRVKKPLVQVTSSILPYIQQDFIRIINVGDVIPDTDSVSSPYPPYQTSSDSGSRPQTSVAASERTLTSPQRKVVSDGNTVLYIEDSSSDSQAMGQIIQSAGYRYVNIADPLQALPQLLELKPKLIFLDLVMPIANGYELCAQIRRISALQETPIVIVTNNDGIADRVRAKVVGASGFLGKPINQQRVLKVLKKHLQGHGNTVTSIHPHLQLSPSF